MIPTNVVSCDCCLSLMKQSFSCKEAKILKVGLDVGSTTIKCVVLDDTDNIVYSTYERHFSHILEKSEELLRRVAERYVPGNRALLAISGSFCLISVR